VRREWDDRELGDSQAAYRVHLRELTAARQAAERRRVLLRRGDAEARRAADQAFKRELARIEEEHQAWLREHLAAEPAPDTQHEPRSRRVVPPR
jgi:hypothetical protein